MGAMERLVSRRRLKVQDGDVVIARTTGGLGAPSRAIYQLRVQGTTALAEPFASFEHAAARGEELAKKRNVRLFYVEEENEPPHLLTDARL